MSLYAIIALVAMVIGVALWLWRKGKKEAYGEAAQEAVKNARKAASVDSDIGHAADDDVFKQLRDKWTK